MTARICGEPDCDAAFYARDMCRNHYKRWRRATNGRNRTTYTRRCTICDHEFTSFQPTAKYCSTGKDSCEAFGHALRFTDGPVATALSIADCTECGEPFVRRFSRTMRTVTCSRRCDARQRLRASLAPEPRSADYIPFYMGRCPVCDRPHISRLDIAKYCSARCTRIAAKRRASSRRRARMRAAEVEHFDNETIFERDGWTCQLCGSKVNRQATAPHPRSAVLDHIVPLAAGGDHVRTNVQCAHFICNSRKGTGVLGEGEQMLLVG